MLVSRGGKTKDAAKHSVTTKTEFLMEYLTKYQTNNKRKYTTHQSFMLHGNPQERRVYLPFTLPCVKPMISISPFKSCWNTFLIPSLSDHSTRPKMKCWKSDAGKGILAPASHACLIGAVNWTHSCELHMIERCLCEQAFLYTGQTAGILGSAGSAANLPLCSQTLKQLDIWQMNKRHDINSNVTYLWTQDVDLQHKHMENHSWPWKNTELSATDPWGTVKF